MKLVHIKGQLFLINDVMTRMAKDLPKNTLVFCIDEFFSGHPEIRLSSVGDNCFGCQPLIATTHSAAPFNISEEVLEAIKLLPDLDAMQYEYLFMKEPLYSLEDIERAYKAGESGKAGYGTLDTYLTFILASKNIWEVEVTKYEAGTYGIDNILPLTFDEKGGLKPVQ